MTMTTYYYSVPAYATEIISVNVKDTYDLDDQWAREIIVDRCADHFNARIMDYGCEFPLRIRLHKDDSDISKYIAEYEVEMEAVPQYTVTELKNE